MAEVYLAHDEVLDRDVALKLSPASEDEQELAVTDLPNKRLHWRSLGRFWDTNRIGDRREK